MSRHTTLFLGICCLGLLTINTGCQESADTGKQEAEHDHGHDHDHHSDRPKSLRAAIVELKEMRDAISTAMQDGDADSAHDPLHKVRDLLKAMPDLAADTDLSESDWDAIKAEVDRLFDAFGDVDSAFHKTDGDKQAAYEAAKSTVDEGIAALEAYLQKLGEDDSPKAHDHEHDDDDHDEHDHDEHDDHDHDGDDHDHEESHDESA